jgi:hypothetical protein
VWNEVEARGARSEKERKGEAVTSLKGRICVISSYKIIPKEYTSHLSEYLWSKKKFT